ncbi:MAG: hypothetical protein ABF322_05045 [Lentimonas sp.]
MNRIRNFTRGLGLALAIILVSACTPKAEYSEGLETLRKEFEAANSAASIQPLLALYYTEGCDDASLTLLKSALINELGLPIKEITFEPLSGAPEEEIRYTHNGVEYGPSLEPGYRMRINYNVEDRLTSLFTIGRTGNGDWRIVCARLVLNPELVERVETAK